MSASGTKRTTTKLARTSVEDLKWTISECDAVSADTFANVNPAPWVRENDKKSL